MDMHAIIEVEALLDGGATGLFINHALVQDNGIATCKLDHPIPVYNINGSINHGGSIIEEVSLIMSYQGYQEQAMFEVCNLGKTNVIIGYTWLQNHNPDINWKMGQVHMTCCPQECNMFAKHKRKKER